MGSGEDSSANSLPADLFTNFWTLHVSKVVMPVACGAFRRGESFRYNPVLDLSSLEGTPV